MANTYTWDCSTVKAYPNKEGKENVIFTVHWRLNASDETEEHHASIYGSVGLNTDNLDNFTPYESLTHADIVSWVEATLGEEEVARMKGNLDAQIEEKINPTEVTKHIPIA
jgi:hypothetical protein